MDRGRLAASSTISIMAPATTQSDTMDTSDICDVPIVLRKRDFGGISGLHKRKPVETVPKKRPATTRGKLPSVTCVVECDTHYDSLVMPANN